MLDLDKFYKDEFLEHLRVAKDTENSLSGPFQQALEMCLTALTHGKKLLFFGNGGSAADAQHLATELTARYKHNRPALAALALTTDTSALTAISNDFGFDQIFSRQIEALGNKGDVAIGISTSGKSPNVLKGFETAKRLQMQTLAFTGHNGGLLVNNPDVDALLMVPSNTTARIQEMHITLGQMLCNAIEISLGLAPHDTAF